MKLIFHDASSVPVVPTGEAVLTIEQKGTMSLSIAAVAQLGLAPDSTLIPVQDADTNAWYLLLSPAAPLKAFRLRRRDKTSKALIFCSTPRARAYYAAHGLGEQKSVRALVAATAIEAEGLQLYPLTPQHPTIAPPAPVEEATTPPVVVDAPAAPVEDAAPVEVVATVESTPAAATPAAPVNETTDERMERLTDYWYEHNIKDCPADELAELQAMLADKRWKDRDIVENQMLNRCKTETKRREKEGGSRG